jgi:hypothetical protein
MHMAKTGVRWAFFRIENKQQPGLALFRGTEPKLARLARDDEGEFSWPQEQLRC